METNQYRNVPDVSCGVRNPLHSECGQVSLDWGHANCKIDSRPNYLSMVFWNHFSQIQFFWLTRGQNHHHFDRIGHFLQISFFSFYMISFGKNPYAVESHDTCTFRLKMLAFGKTVVFSILGEDLLEESFPFRENFQEWNSSEVFRHQLPLLAAASLKLRREPRHFKSSNSASWIWWNIFWGDSFWQSCFLQGYIHSQMAKIVSYLVLIYKFQNSSPNWK